VSNAPLATAEVPERMTGVRNVALQDADAGLRELVAVREIAQALLSANNPTDVYQLALERVSPIVGASFACVYLIDESSELMRLAAVYNWPERYARFLGDMRVRLGFGPSGTAAGERRVIEVPDVFADPTLQDWQEVATELGFKSIAALPLQTANGVLGALTFYFSRAGAVNADGRGLLRVVADQMAATAEKAKLIENLSRTNSELEKQYAAALEARRLQDEFLANVSHELRTPLTAVLGYLSLMEEGLAGPITPEQQDTLGEVKSSSEKLLDLITDLLDLTALKRGERSVDVTEFDAREAMREALAKERPTRGSVKLATYEPPALPMMRSDRKKVVRLLSALLDNAYKFTEKGEIRAAMHHAGDRMIFEVQDTGCGISEEAQRFVFDEFRQEDGSATRKYGGSGLGLAIARRLAQLLGGDLTLSSEQGRGSTFRAEIPISL
jgi:signal transduction histidine kinase